MYKLAAAGLAADSPSHTICKIISEGSGDSLSPWYVLQVMNKFYLSLFTKHSDHHGYVQTTWYIILSTVPYSKLNFSVLT